MSIEERAREVLKDARAAEQEAAEVLLTLKEFAHLFGKNYSAMRRKARRGNWPEATRICGEWWVRLATRDVAAAKNRASAA